MDEARRLLLVEGRRTPGMGRRTREPQQPDHAYRGLASLVVTGDAQRFLEAEAAIQRKRARIACAKLDVHGFDARDGSGFQQPHRDAPADAMALIRRTNGKQDEVRALFAVTHDPKASGSRAAGRYQNRAFGIGHDVANAMAAIVPAKTG